MWQQAASLSERTITEGAQTVRHLSALYDVAPLAATQAHIVQFLAR